MVPADGAPPRAPALLAERAPAKVNLTLHVLGRRADGYHELDSLVAFAGAADALTLDPRPGVPATLTVGGPLAPAAGPVDDNLVLRAERHLRDRVPGLVAGAFHLVKRLPVAAGIGGGSSDAAAALRLLARVNGLEGDPRVAEAARETGADVPVCLDLRARRMRGIGEALGEPVRMRLMAVLVNPGVPTPTAAVFRQLGLQPGETLAGRPGHPEAEPGSAGFLAHLAAARNDLEMPALAVAPAIREALAQVAGQPGCRLARMSGSGSTVFGLFDDCRASAAAARAIRAAQPGWWVRPTVLR